MATTTTAPQTVDDVANQLKAMRPTGPSETLAEGSRALDEGTQGLIEQQAARGLIGNDSAQYMQGVGQDYGLIGKPSANPAGMTLPSDFEDTLTQRSQDAVAGDVQRIQAADKFMEPMRQGQQLARAAGNFAKTESLRFNNWVLKNQQELQRKQLQMLKDAQSKSFLSSVLGLIGGVGGGVAGFVIGGPAGAAAGAGVGLGLGGATGQVAG
jgi:hypothetical protein